MTNTVTYFSQNATNPNETWSAYAIMPNGQRWGVVAFGPTEQQAIDEIVGLYERETTDKRVADAWRAMAQPIINAIPEKYDTRQHHLAGKVWLIHIFSREKIRVDPTKADEMLATGEWQRGGPRSK